MRFKQKVGLSLAMAAIFTAGGANAALAATGNSTAASGADIVQGDPNAPLNVSGGGAAPSVALSTADATVGTIVVDNTATEFTVSGSKALTLIGTGGELLSTKDGKAVDLKTTTDLILSGGNGSLEKTLTVSGGNGTLDVADGAYKINKLVTDNAGNAISISASEAGKSAVLELTELTVTTAKMTAPITVGSADGAGALTADKVTLLGSSIFADPVWRDGAQYEGSDVALGFSGTGAKVDGVLVGGQNSRISIGTTKTDELLTIIKHLDAKDDDIWSDAGSLAAFGVFAPRTLDDDAMGIYVDQRLVAADSSNVGTNLSAGTIGFADKSITVFDLTGVSSTVAALASDTPATGIDLDLGGEYKTQIGSDNAVTAVTGSTSTLYLTNARAGQTYTLISGIKQISVNAATDIVPGTIAVGDIVKLDETELGSNWWGDYAMTSSDLLDVTGVQMRGNTANTTVDLQVTVGRNNVKVLDVYPQLSSGMAGMVESLYGTDAAPGEYDVFFNSVTGANEYDAADEAGIAFVSRATDNRFMPNHREAAAVLEGAAQIAVAAGAPAVTSNVITKLSTLVVDHNNMLNATQPAYGNEPGALGIWATPFYGMSEVDGMDAGRFESGYEMNYGGAAFGIDYNINEAFRLGLALNVGGGDTESKGDFSKTENDFDFFGVSLYGSYTNGSFGLTGDVGFTGVDNEIDQVVPASMQMSGLESNVDSDAFTLGLTGQYRFAASDNFNITPHLGLRYTKISVDDATVELTNNGGRVFKVATDDQNLFQIPLGVEFSTNIATAGGWTITPSADLGVLFTTGDTDVDSRATIYGTGISGRTNADVNDSAAFTGALGIKAAADNGLSLGLDYGILASGNQTDHQFSGMLRFEF